MNTSAGPTLLLPFSQQYPLGYLAWRNPEFIDYFSQNAVQLPLKKGDAVFFSPALFHAGGNNTESSDRIANLLQVSSAFGKPMESVDRSKITKLIYPLLLAGKQAKLFSLEESKSVCLSVVDGYSFPTNLDLDSPLAGSAPETVQTLIERALNEEWPIERFCEGLDEATKRRLA
jgi:ectoine hydroxylase-related dioxygenase (phytanoyl-CoA dioxygenase family)